jgi:hypothetical protein
VSSSIGVGVGLHSLQYDVVLFSRQCEHSSSDLVCGKFGVLVASCVGGGVSIIVVGRSIGPGSLSDMASWSESDSESGGGM